MPVLARFLTDYSTRWLQVMSREGLVTASAAHPQNPRTWLEEQEGEGTNPGTATEGFNI